MKLPISTGQKLETREREREKGGSLLRENEKVKENDFG
jgi:hypothetical protein